MFFGLSLTVILVLRSQVQHGDSIRSQNIKTLKDIHRLLSEESIQKICTDKNVDYKEEATSKEEKSYDRAMSFLNMVQGTNPMKKAIEEPDDIDIQKEVLPSIVPWIGMWVVFFVMQNICYCVYYCRFIGGMTCCKDKEQDKKPGHKWPFYAVCVVMGIIIAFSNIGLTKSNASDKGFQKFSCTLAGTIHDLIWGTTNNDGTIWLGINDLKTELNSIQNSLENELPAKIKARFSGNADGINSDYNDLLSDLETVYTNYKIITVSNPDPLTSVTKPKIVPTYFGNLGPTTTSGKELYPIQLEIKTKFEEVVKQFVSIEKTTSGIETGGGLTEELKSKDAEVDKYINDLKKSETDLYNGLKEAQAPYGRWFIDCMFLFTIGVAIFAIVISVQAY